MTLLAANVTELQARCAQTGGLAQDLVPNNVAAPSETVRDLATLVCSVVDGSIIGSAQDFVNYERVMQEVLVFTY